MTSGKETEPRVNGKITAPVVRLIDHDGKLIGDIHVREALRKAEEAGLDLVELNPGGTPPVCKILDYGKFRYEAQKKAKEARKHQKVIQIKEIKLRPTIGQHDYEVKLRNSRRFIEEGDKVKVTLRFRGREMAHEELGFALLRRAAGDLADVAKIESEPRKEARQIVMMLGPK